MANRFFPARTTSHSPAIGVTASSVAVTRRSWRRAPTRAPRPAPRRAGPRRRSRSPRARREGRPAPPGPRWARRRQRLLRPRAPGAAPRRCRGRARSGRTRRRAGPGGVPGGRPAPPRVGEDGALLGIAPLLAARRDQQRAAQRVRGRLLPLFTPLDPPDQLQAGGGVAPPLGA